jgi:hypothetical protein
MTSRDFCYWLQGFFELTGATTGMDSNQTNTVRNHLALVFKHEIDPSMGGPDKQAELNKMHPKIGGVDPVTGLVVRC